MPAPPPWLTHVPTERGQAEPRPRRRVTQAQAPARTRTGMLDLRAVASAVDEKVVQPIEKFIDPHFSECWTRDGGGVEHHRGDGGYEQGILSQAFRELYDMQGDQEVGLEYLGGVPNTAYDRVKAMRGRIESKAGSTTKRYRSYTDASGDGIGALLRTVAEAASSPDKATALARSLGVPVDQAEGTRQQILAWLDTPPGEFAKILWSNVGPQMMTLARQTLAEIANEAGAAASSIGSAVAAVPIVGVMVQSFTFVLDEIRKQDEVRKNTTCAGYLGDIQEHVKRLADNGMPPPWHLVDLGLDCSQVIDAKRPGTPLLKALDTATAADYYQLGMPASKKATTTWDGESYVSYGAGLPPLDQVALKKWWSLAVLLWSDERVGPVMEVMGADYWGGALASDEQVMAVAAPIAVSYGFDVDDFARKLWLKSEGWRSKPALWVKRAGGGCGKLVDNARVIQFAVLARDAFALAEDAKAGRVVIAGSGGPLYLPSPSSHLSKTPIVLGAVVSGGLWWLGVPVAIASVPLLLGLTLSSGRQRVSSDTTIANMRPAPPPPTIPEIHMPTFTIGWRLLGGGRSRDRRSSASYRPRNARGALR